MTLSYDREAGLSSLVAFLVITAVIGFATIGFLFFVRRTQTPVLKPQTTLQENYYKKLADTSGRFSFEYPAKWKLTKSEKNGGYIFDSPEDSVTVYVMEQSYTITEGSIEMNFSEALERVKEEDLAPAGASNFTQSISEMNGNKVFRLNYDRYIDSYPVKGLFVYLVKDNTFYSISMRVAQAKYSQVIGDFDHLIQSFR